MPPLSPSVVLLLLMCFLNGFYVAGKAENCVSNRHIFTEKYGRIHDGAQDYDGSSRCEWLIKGDAGETVTIEFVEFHTEHAYDRLYVHNGDSQKSPLLASKTGLHNGISITSTGPSMYLVLHSDSGEQRPGFDLVYSINPCPNNCSNELNNGTLSSRGICNDGDGTCNCLGDNYGRYCQYQWCSNDICNQAVGSGVCNVTAKKCVCNDEIYGESCSISEQPNVGANKWYSVTTHSEVFRTRAAHVSGYFSSINKLLVHGGFSLNSIHDDLVAFDFNSNEWQQMNPLDGLKLPALYNHASVVYNNTFIIFGGELREQLLSNQLWSYNVDTGNCSMLAAAVGSSNVVVPGIVGHTLTLVGSKLFVIGGRLHEGAASTDIYVFDLSTNVWSVRKPAHGKRSSLRLYGHSSSYYAPMDSIVVFGGFHLSATANVATNTNKLHVYNVKENIWSAVTTTRSPFLPPPISFHVAVVASDYMVVHGGWTGTNGYEISNATYYYNLRCHIWVQENVLTATTTESNDPKGLNKPVFSHSAVLKDHNTLLVTGGFNHISAVGSLVAYKLPASVVELNETTGSVVNASHCSNHQQDYHCLNDPSCRFCREQSVCYSSHGPMPPGCSRTEFKICSESCSVFTSCESCSSQHQCGWCPLNNACYNVDSATAKCNLCYPHYSKFPNYGTASYSCQVSEQGWWGVKSGNVLFTPHKCQAEDNPPGLTHVEYFAPKNRHHPDVVKILQQTDWQETANGGEHEMLWLGRIYPYVGDSVNVQYKLDLRGVGVMIWLNVSIQNEVNETANVTKLIKQKSEATSVTEKDKRDGVFSNMRLFPVKAGDEGDPSKLWYDFRVSGTVDYSLGPSLKIRWFKQPWNEYHFIERGFLQRYQTNNCSQYGYCMGCITDASCGWCPSTGHCLSVASSCTDDSNRTYYLQRRQEQCTLCTDRFDCESCIKNRHCSWHLSQGCRRQEHTTDVHPFLYVSSSNKFVSTCYASCSSLQNQDRCLAAHGCIWCTGRETCLSFNDYIPQNQFGQCYTFYDQESFKQKNCSLFTSCDRCLDEFSCGWCHNQLDPRIGLCSQGDFSGPSTTCPNKGSTALTSWSYDTCPDVDECTLDIHHCRANSTCVNRKDGFDCKCNQGFEGDGKVQCTKTCWPPCGDHGKCSAEYQCVCDLGWKGDNCSIDCGCHGHSTCVNQTGVCDQCQDYTTGEYCEHCVNGSYGNATTSVGCKKCECNGFGDASRNNCDHRNGSCFCTNNTAGYNCERCKPGFSGDPKVGICVLSCERSNILKDATSGFVGPYSGTTTTTGSSSYYDWCLWTIAAFNVSHNQLIYSTEPPTRPSNILFRVHQTRAMSCFHSILAVYDGIPPNPRSHSGYALSPFKLLGTLCGPIKSNTQTDFRSTTGILTLAYQGVAATKPVKLDYTEDGFLGEYTVMKCPDSCPSPFVCVDVAGDGDTDCTCPVGWTGSLCEQSICHNGCNNATNQGLCDQTTHECICTRGFTGTDCSTALTDHQPYFTLEHVSNLHGAKVYTYVTYGGSMEAYSGATGGNKYLYVFGDTDMESRHYFHEYHINNNAWRNLDTSGAGAPTNRHHHCSFVYKVGMYVYGGITKTGLSDQIFRFDLRTKIWYQLTYAENTLDHVAGHSCTVVGDDVYIIGGYVASDGLSEYVYVMNMQTNRYYPVKFSGGLEPVGIYSHIAIYDEATELIYIHGGMAFYDEEIQLSHKTYAFNPKDHFWDYVQPYSGDMVPTLIGHVAYQYSDIVYIMGGYNEKDGFNEDLYMWKLKCNRWSKLNRNDTNWRGSGRSDKLFSSASYINGSFYMFGGLNDNIMPSLTVFALPQDPCSIHTSNTTCLTDHGCSWCKGTSPSSGICFHPSKPVSCNATAITTSTCSISANEDRECGTFTSCDSCLSNYRKRHTRCHWCRCKPGHPSVCAPNTKPCTCEQPSVIPVIDKCYQAKCGTSTCKNCNNGCFWTNYFRFQSENVRLFSLAGFTYNCFMEKELLERLSTASKEKVSGDVGKQCPDSCSRRTTCGSCLNSLGVNAGSTGCVWSEKRGECLAVEILPVKCSSGMCGQLYSKTTNNKCPIKCSQQTTCLSCITAKECGWCSKESEGFGDCMEGNNLAPYHGSCGVSQTSSSSLSIIDSTQPAFNQTWAYSECPMENECLNGNSDCEENEVCEDRVHGYICKCEEGYKMAAGKCVPHCSNGCGNGTCIEPEQCQCHFGHTGVTCNVSCACNGHSECVNETLTDVCLKCHNNTQGKNCEKCIPLFVGNPINNGRCTPCRDVCSGNTNICMVKSEAEQIPESLRNNSVVVLTKVGQLKNGPLYETDTMCLLCANNSRGEKCEECNMGYFILGKKCIPCECNGHGSVCNPKTGADCECKQNTVSNPTCKSNCHKEQCTKCVKDYVGNPRDEKQCYKRMDTQMVELIESVPGDVIFFAATPSFTNVDIRVTLDVVEGSYEVFITDSEKRFTLEMNDTAHHLHVSGSSSNFASSRKRRSIGSDSSLAFEYAAAAPSLRHRNKRSAQALEYVPAIQASKESMTTYAKYDSGVLVITNIRKRVVITINHLDHDLRKKWFYLALLPINRTSNPATGAARAFVYYRQDLPRIDLLLFFLVLAVILLFILSGFIIGMKIRVDFMRNRRTETHQTELNAMKSRPLASYRFIFEPNEDIVIRKCKNRASHHHNTNKNSKHLYVCSTASEPNNSTRRFVRPVAVQDTEDGLAAVVTSFVKFPENEISKSNYCLASGICQLNSQQLVQVKTNSQVNGKHINTRILSTVA